VLALLQWESVSCAVEDHECACSAGDKDGERRKQEEVRRRQAEEVDADWGGAPKARADTGGWGGGHAQAVPRQEKYDLEPYDDDEYEPEAKSGGGKGQSGYQVMCPPVCLGIIRGGRVGGLNLKMANKTRFLIKSFAFLVSLPSRLLYSCKVPI
jgi:hypothetical protein